MAAVHFRSAISSLVAIGIGSLANAQDASILAANYDVEFGIDGQVHSIQDRSRVRSGSEIPILLQNFKIGLHISESVPVRFVARIKLYEKTESGWHQITVPPPEFSGELGIPAEFSWESGGMMLEIAIIVGTVN